MLVNDVDIQGSQEVVSCSITQQSWVTKPITEETIHAISKEKTILKKNLLVAASLSNKISSGKGINMAKKDFVHVNDRDIIA